MWDLPGPGLKPVSPALAGGFLTTAPPGKPSSNLDYFEIVSFISLARNVEMLQKGFVELSWTDGNFWQVVNCGFSNHW